VVSRQRKTKGGAEKKETQIEGDAVKKALGKDNTQLSPEQLQALNNAKMRKWYAGNRERYMKKYRFWMKSLQTSIRGSRTGANV
jgi:hypothetical protein